MRCLLIEPCDFSGYPTGGQLAFAKQMISSFGGEVALVGISTDDTAVGKWGEKKIGNWVYPYFSIGYHNPHTIKPLLPLRMSCSLELWKHKRKILSLGIRHAMIQAPELLMVVADWKMHSICYLFPGVENPLEKPRYCWGRLLAKAFDQRLFKALQDTDVILASADDQAITRLVDRSKGLLQRKKILAFPTRVDTTIFYPTDKEKVRRDLKLPIGCRLIVCCGRINRVKGWNLILEAFRVIDASEQEARLIFVGDGEDRLQLERQIAELKLDHSISITGFQSPDMVAKYLNAADVAVVGSHKEGWSIAMLEALACGKPIVATDVSGAKEMILEGENGFVVAKRDPVIFAKAILEALHLPEAASISRMIASKYSLETLAEDLGAVWEPLR